MSDPQTVSLDEVYGAQPAAPTAVYSAGEGQITPAQQAFMAQNQPVLATAGMSPTNPTYDSPGLTGAADTSHIAQDGTLSVPADQPGGTISLDDAYKGNGIAAPPPATKSDEMLGFGRSVAQPVFNAADWAYNGLNTATGGGMDKLAANPMLNRMGFTTPAQEQAKIDAPIQAAAAQGVKPGAIGSFLGNVVGTAPFMAAAPEGILGALGAGAASGALSSDKPNDLGDVALNTGAGIAGGALGHGVGNLVGKFVAPRLSGDVRTLLAAGVPLTPGQVVGGGAKTIEDAATSTPFLGDAIKSAQRRSYQGFNRATINNALEPIGEQLPANLSHGRDAIDFAHERVSDAYNQVAQGIAGPTPGNPLTVAGHQFPAPGTIPFDSQFGQDAAAIRQRIEGLSDPAWAARYQNLMTNNLGGRTQNGVTALSGDDFIRAGEAIKNLRGKYAGDNSANAVDFKDALTDLQGSLYDNLARTSPAAADQLGNARAAFARLATVEKAAGSLGSDQGMFTPAQYLSAVKGADGSARKNAFARGNAFGQPFADAAKSVLPSSVPDSGTAMRYAVTELPIMLGVGSESHVLPLGAVGHLAMGAGLAGSLYTRAGGAAFRAALENRPAYAPAVRDFLQRYATPALAAGGASGAESLRRGFIGGSAP